MSRVRLACVAALSAMPFAAWAADAPEISPLDLAITNATHDWAGAYVGVNAGYTWGDFDTVPAGSFSGDGALGGFQIGYNKKLGSFVIGLEGDVQASDMDGASGTTATTLNWFCTARGRVGYAFDSTLLYGTVGAAVAGVETNVLGARDEKTLVGLTAGAGVEQALSDRFSVKAEYLYVDLDSKTFDSGGTSTSAEWDGHVMRFGANLKF